jgi:hypothetical protein
MGTVLGVGVEPAAVVEPGAYDTPDAVVEPVVGVELGAGVGS